MNSEIAERIASLILNPHALATCKTHKTLVIVGASRGGTSIVAYILRKVGYHLGDELGPLNHEDQEILAAIQDNDDDLLRNIIAKRNATYDNWGFKVPAAGHALQHIEGLLRNPIFIVVYRNPLAIARSVVTKDPNFKPDRAHLLAGLDHGLRFMASLTHQCKLTSAPVVLFDADMAKRRPNIFVKEVLDIVMEPHSELIQEIGSDIAQPGYKAIY